MTSLKNIIKEAILEALVELSNGAATYATETSEKNEDKKKEPIQPGILIGPSGFSLR